MTDSKTRGMGDNNPPMTLSETLRRDHAGLIQEVDDLAAEATKARDDLVPEEGKQPEVKTDEQRDKLIEIGKRARTLSKKIEATTLDTTKPHRETVDEIRAFFNAFIPRTDRIKSTFETLVGEYNTKQQEAERRAAAERARIAKAEADRLLEEAAASQHSVVSDVIANEAVAADQKAQIAERAALSAGTGPTRTAAGTVSTSKPWTFAVDDYAKINLNLLRPYFSVADIDKALRAHVRANKNTAPIEGVRFFQDAKTSFR